MISMRKCDYAAKLKYMICLLPSSCISQILWQGGWSVCQMWLCWLEMNVIRVEWSILSNLDLKHQEAVFPKFSDTHSCSKNRMLKVFVVAIFSLNWLELNSAKIFTTTLTSYHKGMQDKSQQSGNSWRFRSCGNQWSVLVLIYICFSWLFHIEKNVSHSSLHNKNILMERKTMTYFSLFD